MSAPVPTAIILVCTLVMTLGACRKAPPKPKSQNELTTEATKQRRTVTSFARGIRNIVEWRQTQPVAKTEQVRWDLITEVVKKLDDIPADDLPSDLAETWSQVLESWHQLTKEPNANPDLIRKGEEATKKLNLLLAANGHPDVRL